MTRKPRRKFQYIEIEDLRMGDVILDSGREDCLVVSVPTTVMVDQNGARPWPYIYFDGSSAGKTTPLRIAGESSVRIAKRET